MPVANQPKPLAKVRHRPGNAGAQINRRLPPQVPLGPGDVRATLPRIVGGQGVVDLPDGLTQHLADDLG